jgi:hypothetical protein
LLLDGGRSRGGALKQPGEGRRQIWQQFRQHAGAPPFLRQAVAQCERPSASRANELVPYLAQRCAFARCQPVQLLLRAGNAHGEKQPGAAGAVVGQIECQLPRITLVVLSPAAVALELAGAHDQALGAQGDELAGQRKARRPRLVNAVHAETGLEPLGHAL